MAVLPIADVATITFSVPIMVTAMSARFIDPGDDAVTSAFYTVTVFLCWSTVTTAAIYLFGPDNTGENISLQFLLRDWVLPTHVHMLSLGFLGLVATGGFYCLIRAYMLADFSTVAPFDIPTLSGVRFLGFCSGRKFLPFQHYLESVC